jgi:hypothetical protein
MIKSFCGILVFILLAIGTTNAGEAPGLEVRKRSAIGGWGVVRAQVSSKVVSDGSILATFHAPAPGSYSLFFTSGPETDKIAMTVNVHKSGPVTVKLRPRQR